LKLQEVLVAENNCVCNFPPLQTNKIFTHKTLSHENICNTTQNLRLHEDLQRVEEHVVC